MPSILREDPVVTVLKQVVRELKILNRQVGTREGLQEATAAVDQSESGFYRPAAPPAPQTSAPAPAIEAHAPESAGNRSGQIKPWADYKWNSAPAPMGSEAEAPDDLVAEPAAGDAEAPADQGIPPGPMGSS